MRIDSYINLEKMLGVSGLFNAVGSFGVIDGFADYAFEECGGEKKYTYSNGRVELVATFREYDGGVVIRRDSFRNLGDKPVTLNRLVSRFRLKGNRYEVYTQFNGWQHESEGAWQSLVTEISVASRGIRSCDGVTPLMALCDAYSGKSVVFNLLPNCKWEMTAKKLPIYSGSETVVVETGFCDDGLSFEVEAGETVYLPEVIFYEADSKIDLDAYKLHRVYNRLYPRKNTPVLYNSWLYCYDYLDIDELMRQADVAAELGVEAFMIDAGWFGEGEGWAERVGDWTENMTGGPCGRLSELSARVRENGMIFGLWFEPERVGILSKALNEHPEYCIGGRFFDFTNPEAREYMINSISSQIDKYNIGWVKFDFNDTMPYDESGAAFYRYFEGQKAFVNAIKEKHPDLYITSCASGGYRMDMEQGRVADSFWLSDNQGPIEGIRIVKDTVKRLPSALIERWCVQKYCEGFLQYGQKEKVGRMLYCNNGTWDSLATVSDGFAKAFMTGGPIGFSSDLAALPESYKDFWKDAIAQFKADRALYAGGEARLLCDSDGAVCIEYTDESLEKCIVQLFTTRCFATDMTLFPVVDENADYILNGTEISGREIKENGILFEGVSDYDCRMVRLEKKVK